MKLQAGKRDHHGPSKHERLSHEIEKLEQSSAGQSTSLLDQLGDPSEAEIREAYMEAITHYASKGDSFHAAQEREAMQMMLEWVRHRSPSNSVPTPAKSTVRRARFGDETARLQAESPLLPPDPPKFDLEGEVAKQFPPVRLDP